MVTKITETNWAKKTINAISSYLSFRITKLATFIFCVNNLSTRCKRRKVWNFFEKEVAAILQNFLLMNGQSEMIAKSVVLL